MAIEKKKRRSKTVNSHGIFCYYRINGNGCL